MERELKTTKLANLCHSEPNSLAQSTGELPQIVLIDEFASLLRVAKVTVYRHHDERRKGLNDTFPLAFSKQGGKLRWLAADIERYLQSRTPPSDTPPQSPVSTPVPSKKRATKSFRDRQEAARQALKRHGINH